MLSLKDTKLELTPGECRHCRSPLKPGSVYGGEFCCAGCQFVHELISSQGLNRFYDLQNAPVPPAPPHVFALRDYTWLSDLMRLTEQEGKGVLTLNLQGISCLGCVWLIERLFMRQPGALAIEVDPARGRIELRWSIEKCDLVAFATELQRFGYLLGPVGGDDATSKPLADGEAMRPLVRRMGLCGAFAMNAMLFSVPIYFGMTAESPLFPLFNRIAGVFATLSFLTGGSYFFKRAWLGLKARMLHLDLPISLGLIVAYLGSMYAWWANAMDFVYFDFISTFTFLMLVGRWVQQKAVEKNRSRLLASKADPGEVAVIGKDESETKCHASELKAGTVYRVEPGRLVPVRSRLRSLGATLGLEWINGESEARLVYGGALVPSGAVNCSQEFIELEAAEAWRSSVLASLLEIRPRIYRNTVLERFLRGYILVVLALALVGFGAWCFYAGSTLQALQVAISILVVSCPCAAGVALPLADELATERLRRVGVFVREQSLWDRILQVRKILFDKTGTLTTERLALANPDSLKRLSEAEQSILLTLVYDSFHPASLSVREALLANGVVPVDEDVRAKEVVGFGMEMVYQGKVWRLGRPGWHTPEVGGDTVFSCNGRLLTLFHYREEVRPDASEETAALRSEGYSIEILSGDRPTKVISVGKRLGLSETQCHGAMTPQEKAAWIRENDRHDTLMIGDGANDSLAFNESFCTGTPAVDRGLLEHKADFYFLGRGLSGVRQLFAVARQRQKAVRRVVAASIIYNVFAVALCLAGVMNPVVAAVLMPISSVVTMALVFGTLTGGRKGVVLA